METTAVLVDLSGRRLTFGGARFDGEGWAYRATLDIGSDIGSATARTEVWDDIGTGGGGVQHFFADLAGLWRGFEGERRWGNTEGEVLIVAAQQELSIVRLEVTVAQMAPPEWALGAVFEVGAGAQLETFSTELDGLFAR